MFPLSILVFMLLRSRSYPEPRFLARAGANFSLLFTFSSPSKKLLRLVTKNCCPMGRMDFSKPSAAADYKRARLPATLVVWLNHFSLSIACACCAGGSQRGQWLPCWCCCWGAGPSCQWDVAAALCQAPDHSHKPTCGSGYWIRIWLPMDSDLRDLP